MLCKNSEVKVQKSHLVSSNGPRGLREGKKKFRTMNEKLRTYVRKENVSMMTLGPHDGEACIGIYSKGWSFSTN